MGRSDIYLVMEIIKKVCYFITIAFFVFFSTSAEILASAYIFCTIIQIIVNSIPNKHLIGYKYSLQFMDIAPNLMIASIMCFSVFLIGIIPMSNTLSLLLQVISGSLIYICLSYLTKNASFKYFLDLFENLIILGNFTVGAVLKFINFPGCFGNIYIGSGTGNTSPGAGHSLYETAVFLAYLGKH